MYSFRNGNGQDIYKESKTSGGHSELPIGTPETLSAGRPLRRCCDDIIQIAGKTCARAALVRKTWILMVEAFTAKGILT
ncbi:jg27542 [Pararge aegeria aegeria]|uniref:Jg27542 protein n=1 Tax=Pararge aegeria aegeria TaxID=348720 RepID=A0A8S4SM50_9NEOP|nr:jg27542 [Pararge aegeria aegeria]